MTTHSHSRLRIAVLCEFPTLLGGERSLLAIEPTLQEEGCELVWFTPEPGRLSEELHRRACRHVPFSVRDSAGKLPPDEMVKSAFTDALRQSHPDLIHGNSLAMSRLLGRLAHSLPMSTSGHLRDIVSLSRSAVADLNRNSRLIAVSHAARDFHAAQGVDGSRMVVVHNGVDVSEFDVESGAATDVRTQLDLPADAFLVATIGQIGLRKGQTMLADAAVLVERLAPPSSQTNRRPIHYLLIGERYSEKAESVAFDEQITATIEQAGLQSRFHRLGYRNDVAQLLRQVDLVVHPARQEPFGRVLLEAAAAERAIIATDVGGTREILTHEESAVLISPDEVQQLVEQIVRLWSDDTLRNRLGANARKAVESRLTLQSCAAGCLQVWREAIERPV